MLSCAGADRLQTGMRGAYGKPTGLAARVAINQVLFSLRTKENAKDHAVEAFRRCKFKFSGRQKIIVSNKWGFTKYTKEQYQQLRSEGKIVPDGSHVKLVGLKGSLDKRY